MTDRMPCTHPSDWPCNGDADTCNSQAAYAAGVVLESVMGANIRAWETKGVPVEDPDGMPLGIELQRVDLGEFGSGFTDKPGVEHTVAVEENPQADAERAERALGFWRHAQERSE